MLGKLMRFALHWDYLESVDILEDILSDAKDRGSWDGLFAI